MKHILWTADKRSNKRKILAVSTQLFFFQAFILQLLKLRTNCEDPSSIFIISLSWNLFFSEILAISATFKPLMFSCLNRNILCKIYLSEILASSPASNLEIYPLRSTVFVKITLALDDEVEYYSATVRVFHNHAHCSTIVHGTLLLNSIAVNLILVCKFITDIFCLGC